jgi:hypothetical protein
MKRIRMDIAMKVAPRGLPTWRRRAWGVSRVVGEDERVDGVDGVDGELWWEVRVVFRRKSWVIAMPMEAKERDVRSQARKVRSVIVILWLVIYSSGKYSLLSSFVEQKKEHPVRESGRAFGEHNKEDRKQDRRNIPNAK